MSKGLEALESGIEINTKEYGNCIAYSQDCIDTIEKHLKALDIIKNKFCFIDKINPKFWVDKSVYNEICTYDYYKFLVDEYGVVIKEEYQLTQEEFDLLKEVLECQKD